uniref:Uncharacterized protein n=1 Tax=Timema bartmani TaxID=61472 RepID=A0A7R9FBZ0_9NEOP|nr:unnamed protein product [Timema bartmani]
MYCSKTRRRWGGKCPNVCLLFEVIEGYKEQLRLMRHLRSLVRANNSDTVLNKIKDWNNTILTAVVSPMAQFGTPPWEVTERHSVLKDCVQEVHTRAAIDKSDFCDPDNVDTQMVCEFQLLCPRAAKPLGLKLLDLTGNTSNNDGSDTPSRQDLKSDQNEIVDNLDDIPTSLGTLSALYNTMIAEIPFTAEKQTEDYSDAEFCRSILLKYNATSNQEMKHESMSTDTKLMKILLRQVQGYVSYVSTKLKIRNDQLKLTRSLYETVKAHSIEDQKSGINYSTEMCSENTLSTAGRDIKNGYLPNLTQEMKSDSICRENRKQMTRQENDLKGSNQVEARPKINISQNILAKLRDVESYHFLMKLNIFKKIDNLFKLQECVEVKHINIERDDGEKGMVCQS